MPFTAFPHQISDPIKLRRTLQVAKKLLKSGKGIDDPSLGYTLFLKGIIRSRGYSGTLRQQLKQIQNEEESAQSPLRIARDLRRFFLLFGFIEESKGQFQVTKRGEILIKASRSRLTKAEKKAWLEGLLDLRLPVNGTTFRPVEMMLEMLVDGPVQTKALAFAFSVASESKKETWRIRRLARRITCGKSTLNKELKKAGISAPNANNSVKILPALMEHIGLITRKARIARLTPLGRTLLDRQARQKGGVPLPVTPQEPWFRIISPEDDLRVKWKPSDVEDGGIEYDPEDVLERARLLKERTNIHQATLDKLRRLLEKKWRLGKGNFDLLAERGKVALLTEVKSIKSGSTKDERLRIIDGIGKLFFYERVDVPRLLKNRKANIQKVMLFSQEPNRKEHITFLKRLGIWVLWLGVKGDLKGEKASKKALMVLMK